MAQASYDSRVFFRDFPTRFSLIYIGGDQGRYSYTYAGSFGDGSGVRLMYVPNSFQDSQLVDQVNDDGEVIRTAAQQWEDLNNFISNDPYLSDKRGEFTERNGAKLPWLHRFDLRITQDAAFRQHRLQLTLDVLNVGNLINDTWGVSRTPVQNNPMSYVGPNPDNPEEAAFNVNYPSSGELNQSFRDDIDINNTWSAQIGIRYMFN